MDGRRMGNAEKQSESEKEREGQERRVDVYSGTVLMWRWRYGTLALMRSLRVLYTWLYITIWSTNRLAFINGWMGLACYCIVGSIRQRQHHTNNNNYEGTQTHTLNSIRLASYSPARSLYVRCERRGKGSTQLKHIPSVWNLENQIKSMCMVCYSFISFFFFALIFYFRCRCRYGWQGKWFSRSYAHRPTDKMYIFGFWVLFGCIHCSVGRLLDVVDCVSSVILYSNLRHISCDRLSKCWRINIKNHSSHHFSSFVSLHTILSSRVWFFLLFFFLFCSSVVCLSYVSFVFCSFTWVVCVEFFFFSFGIFLLSVINIWISSTSTAYLILFDFQPDNRRLEKTSGNT